MGSYCGKHVFFTCIYILGLPLLQAWESREGRLFAYELILKYLLKNHWLYTFGPAGAGYIEKYESTETEADG